MPAFLAKLANPWNRLRKNAKRADGVDGNLVGEGFVHGGVYVVRKGAAENDAPAFAHAEVEIGDFPPTEDLVAACERAAVPC